jgi:hypothetical protein
MTAPASVPRGAPFADVPPTARGHLGLLFYEAASLVLAHLRARARDAGMNDAEALETALGEFPFLAHYHGEMARRLQAEPGSITSSVALRSSIARWEEAAAAGGARLPLRSARLTLGLDGRAIVALVTIGLAEEDGQFASLFATIQPTTRARAPTIGLLRDLVAGAEWIDDAWSFCRPLVDARLVDPVHRSAPRSEWTLRVSAPVWDAIRGEHDAAPGPGMRWVPPDDLQPLSRIVLGEEDARRAREVASLLSRRESSALVVRGLDGADRVELVGAIARELGRGMLLIEGSAAAPSDGAPLHALAGPIAALRHALPVALLAPGPGETVDMPELPGWPGPVAAVLGMDGGVGGAAMEGTLSLTLGPQPFPVRRRQWQSALGYAAGDALAGAAAETFALGGRHVRQAARLASAQAALEGRESPTLADVRHAVRTVGRQQLGSLAQRLDDAGGWGSLVLPSGTMRELRHLEQRCRHRERLVDTLGGTLPGGLGRGVRALFEGPSGTGKTLAARVLATELGVDLYRVDLAAVVNKYIGETEKNLGRVLSRAEDLDVVLLLDEGDALLGRRTDVKSSNDRWANLETNYLLQRLESYAGVVIITTNAARHIDPAFRRRMDAVASFALPDAEARWQLWQLHLPGDHVVPADVLENVSVRHAFTGGQIRVASITATLLALGANTVVGAAELAAAIEGEYRKAGASIPDVDAPRANRGAPALDVLLGAIT